MTFAYRHQLTALDRALANLLDERARLVREIDGAPSDVAIDDVLSRSSGDFPGDVLREVFAKIEAGCSAPRKRTGGAR